MEDGVFGYYAMEFDPFRAEEEQGANQTRDGYLERYQLAPASKDHWVDAHLIAWESEGNPIELEISAQRVQAPTESIPISTIPASTSMTEAISPSTDDNPAVQFDKRPSSNDVQSSSASNDANSAEEWFCNFSNCRKSFTHRHKLKFVHSIYGTSYIS
jgi:hypothetical protein